MAAVSNGVNPGFTGRAPTRCPRFWVVVKHQTKGEDDQSEQRAQHDDGAHVPTPSKQPEIFR